MPSNQRIPKPISLTLQAEGKAQHSNNRFRSGRSAAVLRATPQKFCEVMGKRGTQATIFMGALMGAIFGKNLPQKGKKFPNSFIPEIDKSLNPQHKRHF